MTTTHETDYLVVGAGAMALAFVDTLLTETDADIIIVDRYDKPGGHWRVSYDHVRLHQPSEFYGVTSAPLGSGGIDQTGPNSGLVELASADEIRTYFENVMEHSIVASGRVKYFPKSEYLGNGRFRQIVSGDEHEVKTRRRIVDSTYMQVVVPSTRPPAYEVADDVRHIAVNGLKDLSETVNRYVVVGGGKTGIDAVLWLLERGADPDRITWVVPRDPWMFNREIVQPGPRFADRTDQLNGALAQAWLESTSLAELHDSLIQNEFLFRLSDEVRPTTFRCATVTKAELEKLRTVRDVVRQGRISALHPGLIEFQDGSTREVDADSLFIDCSANGLARIEPKAVFAPGTITLQSLVMCQQVYSASIIAHLEARDLTDEERNALSEPVPHPESDVDYLRVYIRNFENELRYCADPEFVQWRLGTRLSGMVTRVGTPLPEPGPAREAALSEWSGFLQAAISNGRELLAREESRRLASASL